MRKLATTPSAPGDRGSCSDPLALWGSARIRNGKQVLPGRRHTQQAENASQETITNRKSVNKPPMPLRCYAHRSDASAAGFGTKCSASATSPEPSPGRFGRQTPSGHETRSKRRRRPLAPHRIMVTSSLRLLLFPQSLPTSRCYTPAALVREATRNHPS